MWFYPQLVDRTAHRFRAVEAEYTLPMLVNRVPRLLRHRVWLEADPEQGAGRGVLLVPGFGCGDRSLALTSLWLRALVTDRRAHARVGTSAARRTCSSASSAGSSSTPKPPMAGSSSSGRAGAAG